MDAPLRELASLLTRRNEIDDAIAALIARPATTGHIGEFIAAAVFDIELYSSASHKAADGTFRSGPLRGTSVNIKLYGKQEGIIDLREDAISGLLPRAHGPEIRSGFIPREHQADCHRARFPFSGSGPPRDDQVQGQETAALRTSVPQAEWKDAEIWPE